MLHHLMVGTWTPPGAIFTFQFDDEALTLKMIKRTAIPEDEPISWMTFDHAKKNIYGAAMKKWSSFTVKSPTEIIHNGSHPMGHDPKAASTETNTRAIFVLAANKAPFNVYGNPFYDHAGCGNVFSVNHEGALEKCVQNYEYMPKTGIHGMVFDASETYLYSADLRGNKVWTHKKDPETGHLTLVGCLEAPDPLDHPRWVAIHPSGAYLYVLMEAGNRLAVYVIDEQNNCPVFTQITYPLIPPGIPNPGGKLYRSDVVFLSQSGKYLFATSRANKSDLTGYIAAFALGQLGILKGKYVSILPQQVEGTQMLSALVLGVMSI
ncbi:Carboxy-cis,cis-muconate cyclase [Lachnellula occidentalis]|uniref:Carboxy-cis,cis-muconate cyclase n=1 Tax=Lachnellula occidentalis TaxID=215460 RepID=A0A8H8RDV5_9HELO|nr:Carboxy-cis,cis-muconate cyclase [Lachnellula occidentalis]